MLEEQLARLAKLSPADLRCEWARLWQAPAPRLSLDLLRFGIAYRLQEQAAGGLPERVVRALGRLASGKPAVRPRLKAGTQLVRSWHGRTVAVEVTEGGYLFEDRSYRSLTAIAREVTGAAWSGPRFFGTAGGAG
jgi:hypothetical protein